jgi:hypothetical protein
MTIYTPNVPQPNQQIAQTQVPILNNFQYINTAMQVDHIWTDNLANTPSDGSHNKLSMPNQGADIAVLPTGINAVMYAKGGNVFSYNGAKRPISGISGAAVVAISPAFTTLFTVPADCIGFVMIQGNTPPATNLSITFNFNIFSGTPFWQQTYPVTGSQVVLSPAIVGSDFQVATNGASYNAFIKYIYWPI